MLGAASPLGAIAGLLLATAAAAAVHLAFGSSAGRPGLDVVAAALRQLGVDAADLVVAERQQAGLFLVSGRAADGASLDVKVYGRDAHDSAVLSTLWRTVWYRDPGAPLRVGRLQQVEHEAFVTLLAAQAGVPTDVVVAAGATATDDALLVLRRAGRPLTADDAGAATVEELWSLLARLHGAGIAHGRVDAQHLFVDAAGRLGCRDFRGSSAVVSPAQRSTDRVQALVTSVALVGPAQAVAIARRHLDDETVAASLAFLQPAVLTTAQQRAVKAGEVDLAALRTALAATIDVDVPALQQLRRLSPMAILRVVLPAIAVMALFSLVAGLDFAELRTLLADASWWLLAAGLVAAQLPRFTQAVSTIGASPVPLPLGPVYALQLAVSYINIAIPSAAARIAVNIRFFQRHGMPPGTAMAPGALDGFSGFVVQLILLFVLLVFTPASLDLDLRSAVDRAGPLVIIVVVIAAVLLAIVVLVAPLRRFVVRWARRLAGEAWAGGPRPALAAPPGACCSAGTWPPRSCSRPCSACSSPPSATRSGWASCCSPTSASVCSPG